MRKGSAQGITVDAIYEDQLTTESVTDVSAPLDVILDRFAFRDEIQAVYALDTRDRYVGIITERTLLEWLRHNLDEPGALDRVALSDLADLVSGAKAEQAVHPRSGELPVEPHEPVMHAVRNMLSASLVAVPVVTADGTLKGELRFSRILETAQERS